MKSNFEIPEKRKDINDYVLLPESIDHGISIVIEGDMLDKIDNICIYFKGDK